MARLTAHLTLRRHSDVASRATGRRVSARAVSSVENGNQGVHCLSLIRSTSREGGQTCRQLTHLAPEGSWGLRSRGFERLAWWELVEGRSMRLRKIVREGCCGMAPRDALSEGKMRALLR